MSGVVRVVLAIVGREPVLLGAALTAWVTAAGWPEAVTLAAGATIAWLVRAVTVPAVKAAENVEVARWVGAVEEAARHTDTTP